MTVKKKKVVSKKARKVQAEVIEAETLLDSSQKGGGFEEGLLGGINDEASLPSVESKSNRALSITDPVGQYILEIKKYPLLTREQELELAKKYFETKDPIAAQQLVTSNLRFVVKVASEYAKFGARLIDLIQEGNVGLLHAVKEYNPYKGVRLISYAVWWIRGYIQEYLMKQYSLVKIGTTQNQKKLFYRLQKEKIALDKMSETGNYDQIAEQMGLASSEVEQMAQRLTGRDLSLSASVDSNSDTSFLDFQKTDLTPPDEILSKVEELALLRSKIEELKSDLNPKELILLEERLLAEEPATLQEIADRYGITREAVRQAEARLISKLRASFHKP